MENESQKQECPASSFKNKMKSEPASGEFMFVKIIEDQRQEEQIARGNSEVIMSLI